MLCRNPVSIGNGMYARCGGCVPCRVMKRGLWASRMELEAFTHPYSSFVGLTYDDQNLPQGGTLEPVHLKNWLKRIRKAVEPLHLRYFAVGEYGGQTWRPHYHAILYGYQPCRNNNERGIRTFRTGDCCDQCDLVFKTWGLGITSCEPVSTHAFRYVAGYVTKKMASKTDPRLMGRYPEFARMSLKPGIGVPALPLIKQALEDGFRLYDKDEDVPSYLLVRGNQKLMLGKYLQRKLREECGRDGEVPEHVKRAYYNEMLAVLASAAETDQLPREVHLARGAAKAARMEYWEKEKPKKAKL